MTAQQIQELVAYSACIALGILLLAIRPERLPLPLQSIAAGARRVPIAVCAIILGAVLIVNLLVS